MNKLHITKADVGKFITFPRDRHYYECFKITAVGEASYLVVLYHDGVRCEGIGETQWYNRSRNPRRGAVLSDVPPRKRGNMITLSNGKQVSEETVIEALKALTE